MLLNVSRCAIATALLIASSSIISAQEPMPTGLPEPITITAPETSQMPSMSDMMGQSSMPWMDDTMAAVDSETPVSVSPEKPASMTNPSGILPLATGGPFVFNPLPMRGNGCNPRPLLSCTGPDFCGCTTRIYYGTNPCDDDPVLTMSPTISDAKTTHWYQHAFRMVTRKKAITEAIK